MNKWEKNNFTPRGEVLIKKILMGLGIGTGVLLLVIAVLVIGLLAIKLLWAWIVEDLFPGAVKQGLIADKISWWTSFKVALILAILSLIWGRSDQIGVHHS
jgi:hypothetical protein